MRKVILSGAMMAIGLVGCGSAVHQHRGTFGGVVRLDNASDLSHAELLMAEHCGGRFEVLDGPESAAFDEASLPRGGERIHYACARARSASRR